MGEKIMRKQNKIGMEIGENHNFNYYLSSLCNAAGRKVAVSASYQHLWVYFKIYGFILKTSNKNL